MTRLLLVLAGLAALHAAMLLLGTGPVDLAVLRALYAGGQPDAGRAAWIVTQFGGSPVVLPVAGVGTLILIARRDLVGAALLLTATLSQRVLVDLEKMWTARPRPEDFLHLVATRSDSFPSGHTANATVVWLGLALLIPRDPRWRRILIPAAALLALAVGVSRPMLGVHWPSDVVGGWAFGLFWILLLFRLARRPLTGTVTPS